jgi:hypothetical protein
LEWHVEQLPTLVDPILPKIGIVGIVGSSDTGKSTFLRQLALTNAVAGEEFLGFKLNSRHHQSLYISTEDDEYAMSYLLNQSKGFYQNTDAFENARFIFGGHDLFKTIDKNLSEIHADLVIIDAFADVFTGDLNRVNEVRGFLNVFHNMARHFECLFLILHHTGKRTQNLPPSKDSVLGSQGFEGKMRTLIEVRKDPENKEYRHLCILKGNYLSEDYKNESFKIRFDKNLVFIPTFERTPLEYLVPGWSQGDSDKKLTRAFELKMAGNTLQQISSTMQDEGFNHVSKSTVGEILKNLDPDSIRPEP